MAAMSTGAERDASASSVSPAGRMRRRMARDSGATPRSIVWAARAFGFVWIGLITFVPRAQAHNRTDLGVQLGGYAIIGLAMLLWSLLDWHSPAGVSRAWWQPLTLGVIASVSGVIAMTHNGALLVLFAAIAALVAGADT